MMDEDTLIHKCEICKYTTKRLGNMNTHKSSKKHKNNVEKSKIEFLYNCELCNYKTDVFSNLKRHLKSVKHKSTKTHSNISSEGFDSEYEQEEKESENESTGFKFTQDMFFEVMNCNKQLLNIVQNGTTTNNMTNNINSNNTTFNLHFFLNETCKDAMNLKDFIESIEVSISDLKKLGNKGYVEGISDLMISRLNDLEVTKRPIHSTDAKRDIMYVKDEDVWEKDEKDKIKKVLWDVTRKETRALEEKYKGEYPKCVTDRDSKEHEEYWRIFYNAMGGKAGDVDDLQKKVIKKIVQSVTIDKTKEY
jgi:hypothetical protein